MPDAHADPHPLPEPAAYGLAEPHPDRSSAIPDLEPFANVKCGPDCLCLAASDGVSDLVADALSDLDVAPKRYTDADGTVQLAASPERD